MIAQEQGPLAVVGDGRRLLQDVDDRKAVLHAERHEHARHQREVKRHVAFVAVAEIGDGVFRPLIGFGQQHAVLVIARRRAAAVPSEMRASPAGSRNWCLRVRTGRARRPAGSRRRPGPARNRRRAAWPRRTVRIVEVQIGLMRVKAMPVVRLGDGIPGPVRRFKVLEDDAGVFVLLGRVAPHVEIARASLPGGAAGHAETRRADRTCDSERAR